MKNMLKLRTTSAEIPAAYSACRWRARAGFTLIELMITVVVIAIIAAIALPSYQDYVRKGVAAQAEQEMQKIAEQLERYKSKNFTYKYFDPKIVYSDDSSAPALSEVAVPIGAIGDKVKYKITLKDLNDPSKALTDDSVRGSGWAIKAEVVSDPKNYNLLMTSKGLRCKTKDSVSYTACSGSKVIFW